MVSIPYRRKPPPGIPQLGAQTPPNDLDALTQAKQAAQTPQASLAQPKTPATASSDLDSLTSAKLAAQPQPPPAPAQRAPPAAPLTNDLDELARRRMQAQQPSQQPQGVTGLVANAPTGGGQQMTTQQNGTGNAFAGLSTSGAIGFGRGPQPSSPGMPSDPTSPTYNPAPTPSTLQGPVGQQVGSVNGAPIMAGNQPAGVAALQGMNGSRAANGMGGTFYGNPNQGANAAPPPSKGYDPNDPSTWGPSQDAAKRHAKELADEKAKAKANGISDLSPADQQAYYAEQQQLAATKAQALQQGEARADFGGMGLSGAAANLQANTAATQDRAAVTDLAQTRQSLTDSEWKQFARQQLLDSLNNTDTPPPAPAGKSNPDNGADGSGTTDISKTERSAADAIGVSGAIQGVSKAASDGINAAAKALGLGAPTSISDKPPKGATQIPSLLLEGVLDELGPGVGTALSSQYDFYYSNGQLVLVKHGGL